MGCCQVEETLGDIRISSDCCHGFQIVKDDIVAIEETGGLLRHVSTPVDYLHVWNRQGQHISSEAAKNKIKALQVRHVHVFYTVT